MKKIAMLAVSLLALATPVRAALIYTWSGSQVIPNNNPAGVLFEFDVSDQPASITDVNFSLTTSGGYNGDLYAYLSYGGQTAILLDRVGTGLGSDTAPQYTFGFSTSGFDNVILDDDSLNGNIHGIATPGSGTAYVSDGSNLDAFNTLNPNGTWSLFVADLGGGDTATLTSFSLDITAVPEPTTSAALIFFAGLAVAVGVRSVAVRNWMRRWWLAANSAGR